MLGVTQQRSKVMKTRRFVLATSMMVLVAISGQAYAGTTVSDKRYWPSEASSADQNPVERESAFASAGTSRADQVTERSYQGGPKVNY
jgi:hypothetical protein